MEVKTLPDDAGIEKALDIGFKGAGLSNPRTALHWKSNSTSQVPQIQQIKNERNDYEVPTSGKLRAGVFHPLPAERTSSALKGKKELPPNDTGTLGALSRKGSNLVKKSKDSMSSILKFPDYENLPTTTPKVRSRRPDILPRSSSQPKLFTRNTLVETPRAISPLSNNNGAGTDQPGDKPDVIKKDDLKGVFRTLEVDCQKFLNKPIDVRTPVIRFTLLPTLQKYSSQISSNSLRPEDLESRCAVLNKWWAGLLETLKPSSQEPLSSVDRATVHEAIDLVMERPEWRLPQAVTVQRMFTQNMFAQLGYVVERMSSKNAPSASVAFCAKSCAYAFYYCPSAAEILVRLWDLSSETIKRVLLSSDIEKPWSFHHEHDMILRSFPQHLHTIAFPSFKTAMTNLRKKPQCPPAAEKIHWRSQYWITRWAGRETELFYLFVKYFYVFHGQYLPESATKKDRLCSPGFVFVQAQTLSNLDSTIHRNSSLKATEVSDRPAVTFDDLLGVDASAPTLPAPPANATRLVAENRLIILLRDLLSYKNRPYPPYCQLFAEGFCDLFKAAVRVTSLYDHSSCFTLCDLFQEAFIILSGFEQHCALRTSLIDWKFWTDVFKSMLKSESTLTEIRLYALLFTIWPSISAMRALKEDLCHHLLLSEELFYGRFNHWCPMVRTYYMRLLCWRVARCDENPSDWEVHILETLFARLQSVWSYVKFQYQETEKADMMLPSTTPCTPIPGRRLLIIRTDLLPTSGMVPLQTFLASTLSPDSSSRIPAATDITTFSPAQLFEKLSLSIDSNGEPLKKKPSLFRSILGNRTPDSRSRPQSPQRSSPRSRKDSAQEPPQHASPDHSPRTSFYEKRSSVPSSPSKNPAYKHALPDPAPAEPVSPTYREGSFKFSLEAVDRRSHAVAADMELQPPRLPLVAYQYLEARPGFVADASAAKTSGMAGNGSTYAGRALAEWTLVVSECQNFFERRRHEGVPENRLVETPTLGVESLRRVF